MKQNEIEKNTGPSAPASPAATTFTPYVTMYGNKPALVWRNEKGITSLVTADRQKVGTDKKLPVVKTLEVVDGRKSRYAITKMGYLDLSNGDFVDAKTAAAIDAFRNTYATKQTPVATPAAEAPTTAPPAATAPAPAPAPVVAQFSWQKWWELQATKDEIILFSGIFAEDTVEEMASVVEEICNELQKKVLEATTCYDTTEEELKQAVQELWTFTFRAKKLQQRLGQVDNERLENGSIVWTKLDFPIEVSYGLWTPTWVDIDSKVTRTIGGWAESQYSIGITQDGNVIISEKMLDENDDLYQWAVAKAKATDLLDEPAFREYLMGHIQQIYGYHPDQLTLF